MESTNTSNTADFQPLGVCNTTPQSRCVIEPPVPPNQPNSQPQNYTVEQPSSQLNCTFITPDDIDQIPSIKKKIGELVSSYYICSWLKWSDVPKDTKDKVWAAFSGMYKWDQAFQRHIQKRWSHVASEWLKKHLYNARKFDKQPNDITNDIWAQLKEKWSSNEYVKKCQINKQNRAANSGGSIFIFRGGSRSTSEHKRKMAVELGHEPSNRDLFLRCYGSKDVLVDDRAKETLAKYDQALAVAEESSAGPVDHDQLWVETARAKKGRIYGLGNLARSVTSSCFRIEGATQTFKSSHDQLVIQQQDDTIKSLQSDLADMKARVDRMCQAFLSQGFQLPGEVNPSPETLSSQAGSVDRASSIDETCPAQEGQHDH